MNRKVSAKLRPTSREPWDDFPDCHICQAMKQGRGQTVEDLKKVFAEVEALQKTSPRRPLLA
jgi:hypothetical protein